MFKKLIFLFLFVSSALAAEHGPTIKVGIDVLLNNDKYLSLLKKKKIGLVTNHTAVNSEMEKTVFLLKRHAKIHNFALIALYGPEHGIDGTAHRDDQLSDGFDNDGVPVYSLHGKNRRPSKEMLKNVDVLVYDIQDIGTRSYTYVTTLFYVMEEAAKHHIPVVVLDRPNPINGLVVDGPMLEEKWRTIVGYINVPLCHGMTVGELARYFNGEYKVGCELTVVPMEGWRREMSFADTGLPWIPTSPQIPEASTVLYYPMTGLIGELKLVNIGVGYTLPFKVIGAPWIDAEALAKKLNGQKCEGLSFQPFHYRPFYGRYAHKECHGVLLVVTDPTEYKPVTTQYVIMAMLKSLYPQQFHEVIKNEKEWKDMFCKVNGTEEVFRILANEKHALWQLKELHRKERDQFLKTRRNYLIASYW